jgi:glycosyltransferase involved in cell wall biosynthesis
MKSKPLVSVVITFYNQARLVHRAVRSVIQQTYENLEIIIVDDGSKDSVEEEVSKFHDPRIRFFRQENSGVAVARNFGIAQAKGEYIAFLDGDDVFLLNKIELQIEVALKERASVVCSGCYFVTKKGIVVSRRICGKYMTHPGDSFAWYPKINPSMLLYRRNVFSELGGFPESVKGFTEDAVFNHTVFQKYSIISMREPLVLKERDDKDNRSRKVFCSYDDSYSSYCEVLSHMKAYLNEQDYEYMKRKKTISYMRGLLAMGNVASARRWFQEVADLTLPRTSEPLVRFSLYSGVNVYAMLMRLHIIVSVVRYLPVSFIYRANWK